MTPDAAPPQTPAGAPRPVLMSVRPRYAHAIMRGDKRVEFRTRFPSAAVGDVLVYATSPERRVVGRFTVARIDRASPDDLWEMHGHHGGIAKDDFDAYYAGRGAQACALVVADPQPFPTPVPLTGLGVSRPPQSWMYLPAAGRQG